MNLYQEQWEKFKEVLNDVDAVLIGAASGMCLTDGKLYWYKNDELKGMAIHANIATVLSDGKKMMWGKQRWCEENEMMKMHW